MFIIFATSPNIQKSFVIKANSIIKINLIISYKILKINKNKYVLVFSSLFEKLTESTIRNNLFFTDSWYLSQYTFVGFHWVVSFAYWLGFNYAW